MRGHRQIEGSTKHRFFAVLHTERINSPVEAIQAAIVAEHRERNDGLHAYAGDARELMLFKPVRE